MTRVGLIGPPERAEIERLCIRLEERGAEGVVLDARRSPEIVVGEKTLEACGESLESFRAFYVCDLAITPPIVARDDGGVDVEASLKMLDRSRRRLAAWNALLHRLERKALVVNRPETHALHAMKPYEIAVYAAAGTPVPLTVSTSDPDSLANLPDLPGGWIVKGMAGGRFHTEVFDPPRTPEAAKERLRGGPLMVQERIQGDNVRAFVIAGKCVTAAEIVPKEGAEVDSRRGLSRLTRVELPASAAENAVAAAARWGMTFGAVDFMREAGTGRYYVLECNSAPFFVNFEATSGVDVSGMLATHLLSRRAK